MRKAIQFAFSLALLLGAISYPHKLGMLVAAAVWAFWRFVMTVGGAIPVPGVHS